jgi:predicted Zn-dependent peptidase
MFEISPRIHTLSNGLRIVYVHANSLISHLGVTFLAGSRYEDESEIGLAHFLEHCIFKGTHKRKAFHILSSLDAVGGELNAYTTKEEICVYSSFVKNQFEKAADILSDIVINSNFPEKEIEKEKVVVLDEINSYLENPAERIMDDFEGVMFPNHPLGYNILGTPESIHSFGKQHLENYTRKHFFAKNAVVSFVGDLPFEKVIAKIERYFKSMPNQDVIHKPKTFDHFKAQQVILNEGNYQAQVILGSIAPGYDSEERKRMTLLTNILGGPAMNSRLTLAAREKHGYTYNIEAQYNPYPDIGFWSIYFSSDQKNVSKTIRLIHKELQRIREIPLTAHQLKQAKEQLKGHFALSMDSNLGLMQGLGKSLLLFNQIDTVEEILAGIDAITAEMLQETAQKYFQPENISELRFEVKN